MLYNLTLFYNTGFDRQNVPSSASVLDNATKKDFDAVWMLQDRGQASVKVKAGWDDVKDADYCKIGDAYYTINAVNQLNGVAQLSLTLDPILTAGGVTAFRIIDGWVKRASHKTNAFMSNTLPVNVTPTKPLVIDGPVRLDEEDTRDTYTLIGATVDLEDIPDTAKTYIDATDTSKSVTVPDIPKPAPETVFKMFAPTSSAPDGVEMPSTWGTMKQQKAPNMTLYTLYDGDGNMIQAMSDALQYLRALGLEDVITASYTIPWYYARPLLHLLDAKVPDIMAVLHKHNPTALPYKYGSYVPKNNRVYACSNQYTILSLSSGESNTFEAQELYSGGNEPDFYVYADPSPNGKPYCQPTYYNGRVAMLFENAIGGSPWLTTPITLTKQSGWLNTAIANTRAKEDNIIEVERMTRELQMKAIGSQVGNALKAYDTLEDGTFSPDNGYLSTLYNNQKRINDIQRTAGRRNFDAMSAMKIVAPSIHFGRSTEMQGYVGNGFMVYRTRLSDEDMERLDNEFTFYGEPDNRKLEDADLTSHKHFNYVEASNVSIKAADSVSIPMTVRNAIEDVFTGGIRLWHELPNRAAMTDNPLK